jgi:hypothetical protein
MRYERLTSVEDEPIYTNLFVSCNTYSVDETILISQRAKRSHQPTVTIPTLTHIAGSWAIYVELWSFEDVLGIVSIGQIIDRNTWSHEP